MNPGELILWVLAIAGSIVLACIALLVATATVQQMRRRKLPDDQLNNLRARKEQPRG